MFCGRCDRPILPGEPTEKFGIDGASVGGGIVVLHAELCVRAPRQTVPERIRR